MKLVITGASGFVGTELIRQSLKHPGISSVIAVARKPLSAPTDLDGQGDPSKFRSVKIDNYGVYTEEIKKELAGADACIWTVAITPSKSGGYSEQELKKICYEDTLAGLQATFEASKSRNTASPFRFLYMSGIAAERDQTKTPDWRPKYSLMRGETENAVLKYAAEQGGMLEASVAKPGLINRQGDILKSVFAGALKLVKGVPSIYVTDISIAMLDQVVNGFEKDPLMNDDLIRISQKVLATKT